jgi:nitrate/nitrite-specific signal transduction histidine kinase
MQESSSSQIEPSIGDGGLVAEARRKRRRPFGLLAKATLAMLVVGLVPLLGFSAVTLIQQGHRIRDEAGRTMQGVAERMAAQVDEWVDKNVRALETAASLPSMTAMQRDDQTKVLAAIRKEYPWMYLVFTIAPSGLNVARSDDQPLTSYADRQYFKDVVTKNQNLAWETLIGKTSRKPALVMALIGLLLLASAAVLVVVIAMAASKILVRPIVDMTHAAEQMSIGELETPIRSTSKDELGMLAKALERLRRSMIAAIERL